MAPDAPAGAPMKAPRTAKGMAKTVWASLMSARARAAPAMGLGAGAGSLVGVAAGIVMRVGWV